jgi:GntR family transcriptional regulator, transcriptional repressor for pyruvate dehydrogenase complex
MAIIKKKKMADSVIEEIKRMIESGELKEGDKLPNQNEFAAQLNVSRTSLREALRVLDLLGAIEQRPGFGTVIRKYNPVLFSTSMVAPPLMSDTRATIELIEARAIIETGAAELAARNASDDQIKRLSGLIAALRQALEEDRTRDYIECDMAFHGLIAEASNNRFISYSFQTLKGYIEQYMQEVFVTLPKMLKSSIRMHQDIEVQIARRHPEKAAQAMQAHITDIRRHYEQFCRELMAP